MINVKDIMKEAARHGACSGSGKVTDWKSLCWLFFTPQGREFCMDNKWPTEELFRQMKDSIRPYGMYVDAGEVRTTNPDNIALIGSTFGELDFSGPDLLHRIVLMHGAKATIRARHYAVLHIVKDDTSTVELDIDETVRIL